MPVYEYECLDCGKQHEIMQKIKDQPLSVCPACGGNLKRIISNTSFVLKGSGWYATDYAAKGKKAEGEKGKGAASGDSKGKAQEGEKKSSDSAKPESKETVAA